MPAAGDLHRWKISSLRVSSCGWPQAAFMPAPRSASPRSGFSARQEARMRPPRTSQLLGFLAFGLLAALAAVLAPAPVSASAAMPTLPVSRRPWLAWGLVAGTLIATVAGVLGYRAWTTAAELEAV